MWYWRDTNFRGLSDAIRLLSGQTELAEYVEYLRYREQGLRKKAFDHLNEFIATAQGWSFEKRCNLADGLLTLRYERPGLCDLIPTPLHRQLIAPTLDEWMEREPNNPAPWRWRDNNDDLRRAILLGPNERIARELLAGHLLSSVEQAVHELPYGYLGSPSEDLLALDEVEGMLPGCSVAVRPEFEERLKSVRKIVKDYISLKALEPPKNNA